jgi:uncharacterized protein (DUF1697 family)
VDEFKNRVALRGVMPTNCKMADLKRAFESVGFREVRTVLGSGNVVFSAPAAATATLERKAEAAMEQQLGRSFLTIVRSVEELEQLLATDPYQGARIPANAKRNVTFLRTEPRAKLKPRSRDGASLVGMKGREVFSAHVPYNPKGAVFMALIQETLGKEQTTRTWQTVEKVARS